ncbi:MAG: hypothetical protein LUD69_05100 [Oscillospiraceae bacterium]|nr:hypothetical protein [Oscillospiraceae bacterium]
METVYFTTRSFIRREGNVVDLNEYREKLAELQGQALPEQPRPCLAQGPGAPGPPPPPSPPAGAGLRRLHPADSHRSAVHCKAALGALIKCVCGG